ncbi:MAG: MarR family transcriptional regulator [Candidatus Goldbacteria bacterium]|nr:MarR family transcriptional regulator [Candidatus Goldiibacteriota bacterium]
MDNATKELISTLRYMTNLMKKSRPILPEGMKKITLGQLQVLECLCEHKRMRMSDLAKEANVKLPTMTELVDNLVKQGMLQRERKEDDRRTVWVTISPDVEKFAKKMMKEHERYIEKIMSVLSYKEKKQATKIISKLIEKLKKDENIKLK